MTFKIVQIKNFIYLFVFVLVTLIFIYLFIGDKIPENFYSKSSSLYFFSALLQSNAAIISLFGVFIVFRLQSLQTSLDLLKNTLMQDGGKMIQPNTVFRFDKMNLNEKEERVNTESKDSPLRFSLQAWLDQEREIDNVKRSIKNPAISITITIIMVLNILGLICSNYIHHKSMYLEFYTHCVFVILQIQIFLMLIKAINQLLGNRKKDIVVTD
jgi:hypothetical protein